MRLPSGNPLDQRRFRHFARLDSAGAVVAIVEVADTIAEHYDTADTLYVEVTDLYPYDFQGVRVALPVLTARPAAPVVGNPLAPTAAEQQALATYRDAVKSYRATRAGAEAAVKTILTRENKGPRR
jgi:hypothetical protein